MLATAIATLTPIVRSAPASGAASATTSTTACPTNSTGLAAMAGRSIPRLMSTRSTAPRARRSASRRSTASRFTESGTGASAYYSERLLRPGRRHRADRHRRRAGHRASTTATSCRARTSRSNRRRRSRPGRTRTRAPAQRRLRPRHAPRRASWSAATRQPQPLDVRQHHAREAVQLERPRRASRGSRPPRASSA